MNTRLPKFAQRNQEIEGDRIAIIAILAAMLLPALQSARARGQATSCLNQIKTMGTSMMMYADQYDEVIAPYNIVLPGSGNNTTWGDILVVTQKLSRENFVCPSNSSNTTMGPLSSSVATINSYFYQKQTYMTWSHYGQGTHYGLGDSTVKLGNIRSASSKILHSETHLRASTKTNNGFNSIAESYPGAGQYVGELDASRHMGKINTGFADGHGESIAVGLQIPVLTYTADRNPYKFSPFDNYKNFRPLE